jgi:hypothetical protein
MREGEPELGQDVLQRTGAMRGISQLQKCSPGRARAVGGCRRGWPSRQGAGADLDPRREMPFRRPATPTGLIALSHVRPSQALGHGTNDVMAANQSPGGGFGLLAGLKVTHASNRGSKGPLRATPHGLTVFAVTAGWPRRHRVQAQGLALPLWPFAGLAQEQEPGVRGDGRCGRGD